jgi:hypothetical protein
VVGILGFLVRFYLFLLFELHTLQLLSAKYNLTELGFTVVLSFNMGIECGITQIRFTTCARKVSTIPIISRSTLPLLLRTSIRVVPVRFRGMHITHSRLPIYLINYDKC